MNKILKLSVHDIVDFLLRTGDIDKSIYNIDTMKRGSELHSFYQKRKTSDYISEYYLSHTFKIEDFTLTLEGRADGIIFKDVPIIEELKSTVDELDNFYFKNKDWHLGQAICYAYMLLEERKIDQCEIRLTYISQIDNKQKTYTFLFNKDELKKKVYEYLTEYISFYKKIYEHKEKRNLSIENLKFPFSKCRTGQKELIKEAYFTSIEGGTSFIEAPTGVGKTISVIFPSIKSFTKSENDKIFYLTAKNTGKNIAYDTLISLLNNGLDVYGIYITAKEKICACSGASCNPNECPYAKDYYTNLKKSVIYALENYKLFNENSIKLICEKFKICPFEFSLDLSNYVDIVIADYNYFFDPIIKLDRYFNLDSSKYLILVDEAHNLLDRANDMYSESIPLSLIVLSKNDYRFATTKLKKAFSRLIKNYKKVVFSENQNEILYEDLDHELYLSLNNLHLNMKEYLKNNRFHPDINSVDFSRRLYRFLHLYENRNESDAIFMSQNYNDITLNLLSLDCSYRLNESFNQVKGAILFSATLNPLDYYINVLGGDTTSRKLILPSPFPKENFKLLISPINVRYKQRDLTLNRVINLIDEFINAKKGNYLIFAPSFEYLDKLTPYFMNKKYKEIYIQNRDMNEIEKNIFLSQFKKKSEHSVIGLGVLGGAFAEGIDLVSDSLIGVVVIGVGLPTISFKRNLVKEYFDNKDINGFSYAYKHPGMNKVTQAVGRLIRSEEDVGAALLIDDRYLLNEYRKLFKKEWNDYEVINSIKDLKIALDKFWNQK